jgi:non-heme chloroperoxidase
MKRHTIRGGGGARIHVVEAGDSSGPAILFLHGFSQNALAWSRQLNSDLARGYRLLAMDLRGHGASERPRDGYDDSRLWADDVNAAIRALEIDHPVLCGWSYGPLVILDYVRQHGEDEIGGIHFVDGVTKLGSPEALAVLAPEFLALVPGFFATEVEESVRSLESLLRMCFAREIAVTDLFLMMGWNVAVPPFVRQGLFSRSLDNDDVLASIRKPLLITHGADDAIVKRTAVDQVRAQVSHAQVHIMPNAGHAPFFDDAPAFNRRLADFTTASVTIRTRASTRHQRAREDNGTDAPGADMRAPSAPL